MATFCARSRGEYAARRCRPGTSLPLTDRLAVIQYIKHELAVDRSDPAKPYAFFVEEPPGPPLYIPRPPPPRSRSSPAARTWQQAKCWECHGNTGKGDGEKAPGLKDDLVSRSHPRT